MPTDSTSFCLLFCCSELGAQGKQGTCFSAFIINDGIEQTFQPPQHMRESLRCRNGRILFMTSKHGTGKHGTVASHSIEFSKTKQTELGMHASPRTLLVFEAYRAPSAVHHCSPYQADRCWQERLYKNREGYIIGTVRTFSKTNPYKPQLSLKVQKD